MAVAFVEPHFVGTRLVVKHRHNRTGVLIDDHCRMLPVSTGAIAAEQDLIIRPDRHALRSGARVVRDGEDLLDRHAYGVDHRNATGNRVVAGAVDFRDAYIDSPGSRAPLALLGAVGG